MSDKVKFTACKHLSYDRKKYVPSVMMNLISHYGNTKVVWDREDVDGNMQLVQFCTKRGRLNYPTACLNKDASFVCHLYEDTQHVVALADIETD